MTDHTPGRKLPRPESQKMTVFRSGAPSHAGPVTEGPSDTRPVTSGLSDTGPVKAGSFHDGQVKADSSHTGLVTSDPSHAGPAAADPAQLKAICHGQGPCAVIAGPGSGKTFVLVERVRYLIDRLRIDPSGILVMTFSRSAALEMRNRFMSLELKASEGKNAGDVIFGTFHSVFYRILQESSGERLRIVRQDEKYRYLRHLCELRPDFRGIMEKEFPDKVSCPAARDQFRLPERITVEELQLLISRFKNGLPCVQPWVPALIREYDNYLKSRGCLDFDDMILKCRDLLRSRPDICTQWSSRFQWILVDEFQDVSPSQYQALLLIAAPRSNLFIVGDDDQSIYGFRGADPGTMKRFLADFGLDGKKDPPGRIYLTANYRCGQSILKAGAALIRENSCRIPKTFRAASPEPGLTACRPFTDRRSQYEFIAGELLQMTPGQRGRTGIIFRTHAAAAGFTPFLAEKKIPFLSNGKGPVIKSFSERIRILRDLTAYYRSAVKIKREGAERKDLLRIMNCPERFLSGSFIHSDRPDRDSLLANAGYERAAILDLLDDLDALNTLTPAFSFRYLMDSIGYRDYAAAAFPGRCGILEELTRLSKEFNDIPAWLSFLEKKLTEEEKDLFQKKPGNMPSAADSPDGTSVHIVTMHACKGLEYDTVYIPDLNEGTIPARQAWTRDQIEEERRLLYVAVTRAKKTLTITYLEGNPDRPAAPSRFLRPLLKSLH